MKIRKKHLHHHAQRHSEAHFTLKKLISEYNPTKEKVFLVFITTFIIVLLTLLIFRNWGNIISVFTVGEKISPHEIHTLGVKTGVLSVYKVDDQANREYRNMLASVATHGSIAGAETNAVFGQGRDKEVSALDKTLKNSIWITNYLSTGQHLTKMEQKGAKALQKSIISTYYLGEKTVDITSTMQTDSKILSQIKNALSVDLFQYLNQSANRADSLDEYLHLLGALSKKTDERIQDLQYKIDFLSANYRSKETEIKTSEQIFFENLKIFDGPNSEEELSRFVGLQEAQVEIRAKIGAYKSLQDYYKFFKPRTENLIRSIQVNRGPLIAGVKVIEIQNMSLPLIIKEK